MDILQFIQIHHLQSLIYLVIFLAIVFDAAITVFAAMFLLVQGVIAPLPTLIVLVLGVLGEQILWYWIGRRLTIWKIIVDWSNKIAQPFDKHLINKPLRTLTLSKFIYGIHRAMLVRAGMLKIDFYYYLKAVIFSTVVWLGVLGGLGYGFSESYAALKEYVKYAELIPLCLVMLYFIVDWLLAKNLKRNL